MSAEKNWQFELEEYIKQGEPGQIEKSEAWQTAIGLQAVDGLKTSAYLLDTAKEHIEGKISIDEAQKRIQSYYEQRTDRASDGCLPYDWNCMSIRSAFYGRSHRNIYLPSALSEYPTE